MTNQPAQAIPATAAPAGSLPAAHRGGRYRRRIVVVDDGRMVHAAVEDDPHHYEVDLQHENGIVTDVRARSLRTPWTTCPEAMAQLDQLIGAAVGTDVWRRPGLPDPHGQCTHMYELALLAMAQAARGGARQYDLEIPDRVLPDGTMPGVDAPFRKVFQAGRTRASLMRDGAPILHWELDGITILPPSELAGRTIMNVGGYAAKTLDDEALEAVKLLRRGCHVSLGRHLVDSPTADFEDSPVGACYVFQPERMASGLATRTRREFSEAQGDLLSSGSVKPLIGG